MRKATLTVLGLLGLSLLLCGADEVLAQTDTRAFPPGSPGSDATDSRLQGTPSIDGDAGIGGAGAVAPGTGQAAGGAGASPAELQQTVLQLQSEVARLQQELAQTREQLANVTRNTGAGGAGQAGVAPTAAPTGASAGQNTPASGGSGQGAVSGGTTGQRATNDPGAAVVHAIYRGKVRSVSNRQLVLEDDSGQPFTVELGAQTRFISKGQRISPQELKQGMRVRATVDMLSGHNQAMEVATLPER
jgi:TolA-binding protein